MSGWLTGAPTMTQRLKVAKTKEMIIYFMKNKTTVTPLAIREQHVELVVSFKFMGTTITNTLKCRNHRKESATAHVLSPLAEEV